MITAWTHVHDHQRSIISPGGEIWMACWLYSPLASAKDCYIVLIGRTYQNGQESPVNFLLQKCSAMINFCLTAKDLKYHFKLVYRH